MFNSLQYFTWADAKKWLLIGLIASVCIFLLADVLLSKKEHHQGVITDKHYTPERHWTTISVHSSKSGSYTTVQHHYLPPEWDLIVDGDDGHTVVIPVSSGFYQTAVITSPIPYNTYIGYFTGWRWFSRRARTEW